MVGRAIASSTRGETLDGPGPISILLGAIKDFTIILSNFIWLLIKVGS